MSQPVIFSDFGQGQFLFKEGRVYMAQEKVEAR